jgi:hypothetical protein
MTTEHRKAPRRKVLKIERTGDWGGISYCHQLSCGHKENRQRKSSTKSLACVTCLKLNKAEEQIKQISSSSFLSSEEDDLNQESEINSTRASLALHFGVPLESVDIASNYEGGYLQTQYAVIFLSPTDIETITKTGNQ